MSRLRYNNLVAALDGALDDSDDTITLAAALSYAGGNVPTLGAGDYLALSIDDEIVYLTDYTEADTDGSIARGQEGTAAAAHDDGAVVTHGPTTADFGDVFTPGAGRAPGLVPAGLKLRGGNITPQGDKIDGFDEVHVWKWLYATWADSWPAIVKPQLDLAATVGTNAIRIIGDIYGVHHGDLALVDYVRAYEQLVDYCANLGMRVYACLSAATEWGGATKDEALVIMRAQAAMLETKPNVVGIDVVQEIGLTPALYAGSSLHDFVEYLLTSLREVTTLPLTCSVLSSSNNSSAQWSSATTGDLADVVDFYDFHPYYEMDPADLDDFFTANTAGKPLVLGEWGGTAVDTDVHTAAVVVLSLPRVAGGFIWSIGDNTDDTDWGLFDYDFTERTDLTVIFRTQPDRASFTVGGHLIQDTGAPLPTRAALDFVGAGVTVTDDPDNDRTVVTIDGGGGGGGGGTPAHAEWIITVPTGSNDGTVTLGTATLDSDNTTDDSFVTGYSGGVFDVDEGVYAVDVFVNYNPLTINSGRHFVNVYRDNTDNIAWANPAVGVSESGMAVSAAGVYATESIGVSLFRGTLSGTTAPEMRICLTKLGS